MGLEVLYVLIPMTLILAVLALAWFLWAIHNGQFDDLETPALRILFDEEPGPAEEPGEEPRTPPAHARPDRTTEE